MFLVFDPEVLMPRSEFEAALRELVDNVRATPPLDPDEPVRIPSERSFRERERNRTLAAEVQDLKKGTTAIEERARTDLGMVGKSETFYQVVSPENAPPAAGSSAPTQTPP